MANVTPFIMDETGALSKVSTNEEVQFTSEGNDTYETVRLTGDIKNLATNRTPEANQTVPDFISERNFDGLNDAVNRIADKLNLLTAEVNGKDDILIGPRNLDRLRDNVRILIKELYRTDYTDAGAATSERFSVAANTRSRLDYLDKSLYSLSFSSSDVPYKQGSLYNGKSLYNEPTSGDFLKYSTSVDDITDTNAFYNKANIIDILIDAVAGDQNNLLRKKQSVDYFNTTSKFLETGLLTATNEEQTRTQLSAYQNAATKYRDSFALKDRLTRLENALDKISLRTTGRAIFDPIEAPAFSTSYFANSSSNSFLTFYNGLSSADMFLQNISQILGLTVLNVEDRKRLNGGTSPSNTSSIQLQSADYKTSANSLKTNKKVGLEGFAYTLLDHEDRVAETEAYRACLDANLNSYYDPIKQSDGTYKSTYSIGNETRYIMDLLYPTITQSVNRIIEISSGENNGLRDYGMADNSISSLDKVLDSVYNTLPATTSKTGKDNKAFIAGYNFTSSSERRDNFGSEEQTALDKVRKIMKNDLETRFDGIYTELAKIQNALGFSIYSNGTNKTILNTSNFLSIVDSISVKDSPGSISFTTPWKTGYTEKSCHGVDVEIKCFDKNNNEISSVSSAASRGLDTKNKYSIADYALSAWANSIYLSNSLETHHSFIQSEMSDIDLSLKSLAGILRTLVGDTDYNTATGNTSIVPKTRVDAQVLDNTYTLEQLKYFSTYAIDNAVRYKADSQLTEKYRGTNAAKVLPLSNTYFLTGKVYSSATTGLTKYQTNAKEADVFMPMSEFDNWANVTTQSFSDTITSYKNAIDADLATYKRDVDSSIKNCTDTVNTFADRVSFLESQSLSTDKANKLGIVYRKKLGTDSKDDAETCFDQVNPSTAMFDLEWKDNALSAVQKQVLAKNDASGLTTEEKDSLKVNGLFVNFAKDTPVLRTTQIWSLK